MPKYGVSSGRYFPVFRRNAEIYFLVHIFHYSDWVRRFTKVNLHIQSEYRNIQTRKNSVSVRFSFSEDFHQPPPQSNSLQTNSNKIYQNGAPLENCLGFVDGAWMTTSKLKENQIIITKGVHTLRFQIVALPNSLIAHISGPFEDSNHDSGMLLKSSFLNLLQ